MKNVLRSRGLLSGVGRNSVDRDFLLGMLRTELEVFEEKALHQGDVRSRPFSSTEARSTKPLPPCSDHRPLSARREVTSIQVFQQEKQLAKICLFTDDQCKYGERCRFEHRSKPFQWQMYCGSSWADMSETDNCLLEDYFSVVIDATDFELSCGSANVADMCVRHQSGEKMDIRSLSTPSETVNPRMLRATRWTWYYKGREGLLCSFENDDVYKSTNACTDIEKCFYSGASNFIQDQKAFQIFFDTMTLREPNGTTRPVVRRPAKLAKRWSAPSEICMDFFKTCKGPCLKAHVAAKFQWQYFDGKSWEVIASKEGDEIENKFCGNHDICINPGNLSNLSNTKRHLSHALQNDRTSPPEHLSSSNPCFCCSTSPAASFACVFGVL